jgi:ankyrin repeat protein
VAEFLHDAVERGDIASATELIAHGANVREKENDTTLLQVATSNRDLNMVRYLLKNGADANQTSYSWGYTALAEAAWHGADEIVRELLAHGADVNAKLDSGSTALMMAAQHGNRKVVQILLDAGADVKAAAKDGQTALSIAEKQKHEEVARILRARQGAGLTSK